MFKFIIAILIFNFLSCNQSNHTQNNFDTKIIDFGLFTIETPKTWTKIKEQGVDSYVGKIAIDSKDTLEFDLGLYSWDLLEYLEMKMPDGKTYYISAFDTARNTKLIDSANRFKVIKSNISWDTIDGKKAKILSPINSGTGITGVYIDSIWKAGSSRDRFSLYGLNLQPKNDKEVLKALRTLKFHKK